MKKSDPKFVRSFDRGMLRAQFVSLFWAVFSARKKERGLKLVDLAAALGANKAEVSRWFSGDPNWTANTMANLAHALNVDLKIEAVDRATGTVFTAQGPVTSTQVETQPSTASDTHPPLFIIRNGPPIRSSPDQLAA